jgi:expansin (peptidoglycan-binding protein)
MATGVDSGGTPAAEGAQDPAGVEGVVTPGSEVPGAVGPGAVTNPNLIDDFEDGDSAILALEGRAGHWGTYNDGTGTQSPEAGSGITPETGGADGTLYAVHTEGSGFSDWGAGLQVDLNNSGGGASARLPFDASTYAGISFYARGSGNVRVELLTKAIAEATLGGTCSADCNDAHGALIDIGAEWQSFTIAFAQVAQEGWGGAADFLASELLGINFKMTKTDEATPADFDFWIDELTFVAAGAVPAVPGSDPDAPESPDPPEPEPPPEPTSTPGMCSVDLGRYDGNGSVTYYTFDMGSSEVNCSYQITGHNPDTVANIYTGEGRYFGAMNTSDYNNAAMCGACVEVTRDGGRTVTVTIVDQCPIGTNPKCTAGHIDLSVEAFRQLGDQSEGHLGTGNGGATGNISWRYVPCPVDGQNVKYRLKEPDRTDWNELLVQGHRFPISSVEINGQAATRKDYNYWEPPGNMGPGPYQIRVTDRAGGVIDSTVERNGGGELDSGLQFTCQ